MKAGHETAAYKVIADGEGNCYRFYCGQSNLAIRTTRPIRADTPDEELRIAWETEARPYFNKCRKCGKWVSDLMFNVDTSECVVLFTMGRTAQLLLPLRSPGSRR